MHTLALLSARAGAAPWSKQPRPPVSTKSALEIESSLCYPTAAAWGDEAPGLMSGVGTELLNTDWMSDELGGCST